MTDYEIELRYTQRRIEEVVAGNHPDLDANSHSATKLLYLRFQQISMMGETGCFDELDGAVRKAIRSSSRPSDLWLLRAWIALQLHRFANAEVFLGMDDSLAASAPGRLVRADVDLQCGRYSSARVNIELALADEMSWEGLARLAYLAYVMGDIEAADDLYLRAEDELTVKQMRSFAWVETRRGLMNLARGRHDRALEHYRRAESAYSGHWQVEERLAELMGVQGRFDEAIATYRRLYDASPKPEWEHALGDLYFLSGELSSAYEWKIRALESYLKSTSHGQVHYLHSLVDLSCEMPGQSARATEWARRDEELRSNYLTQGALAWALYRNGENQDALEWLNKALASGAVSEQLYLQAACIYAAVGDVDASARYMRLSRMANPLPAKARFLPSRGPGLGLGHRELTTVPFVL